MNQRKKIKRSNTKIVCAYLYIISKYGYPPKIEDTKMHIDEMAQLGFSAIELEGIGSENLAYLHTHRKEIAAHLENLKLEVPIFCIVLPKMSSFDPQIRKEQLDSFRLGCEFAAAIGAEGVLDNGPLPPYEYPSDMSIQRHYTGEQLYSLSLPQSLEWKRYWEGLATTFRDACAIADTYGLQYHLHPCEGSLVSGTDGFENFKRAVDRENLMFNVDTANQFFLKDNISLSVLRSATAIKYIHISDNSGLQLGHLRPGSGKIHWDSFFNSLKKIDFSGRFGIDIGGKESPIENLDKAYLETAIWLEEQIKRYQLFV